jgi:hypothetical protein
MENEDLIRELKKIHDVFDKVIEYLQLQSETNAHLHMSRQVMYPPLTAAAILATNNFDGLISRLESENG